MESCKLCRTKDADKKGSHIVPHFLLKRIENIDGKTGRGYEIGYKIERLNSSSYFGRSVQPEKLEETYGEISEEDIAKNQHPLVVDNFFCADCEDRLAQIENEYSKTINTIGETEYESGVSFSTGLLFWGSVLWRMSVHGQSGVILSPEINEIFRENLNSFLPNKNLKLDEELITNSRFANLLSYKLLRCYNAKVDDTKSLFFHPEFFQSLCLFIDEFVLVLSLEGQYTELETINCLGMNDLILKAPINSIGNEETIKPFNSSIFRVLNENMINLVKDVYVNGLFEFFDLIHVAAGGQGDKMPKALKQEILNEIIFSEKKIGRRYTQDEIINSAYKIMKKYAP